KPDDFSVCEIHRGEGRVGPARRLFRRRFGKIIGAQRKDRCFRTNWSLDRRDTIDIRSGYSSSATRTAGWTSIGGLMVREVRDGIPGRALVTTMPLALAMGWGRQAASAQETADASFASLLAYCG